MIREISKGQRMERQPRNKAEPTTVFQFRASLPLIDRIYLAAKQKLLKPSEYVKLAVLAALEKDEPNELTIEPDPPVVFCREEKLPGGTPCWTFFCKYCRRRHIHSAEPGHRAAHCCTLGSKYYARGYILALEKVK